MASLFVSYFLIIIAYLAGVLSNVVLYGKGLILPKWILPHYSLGDFFMKGIFFLLPAIILAMLLPELKPEKKEFKTELLKSFMAYGIAVFAYSFFNEINVYTAKNPLHNALFWVSYVFYTLFSFGVLSVTMYVIRKEPKNISFIFFGVLLVSFLYSYTIKRYFVHNRVLSTIYFKDKSKITGKIIADDESSIYILTKEGLHIVGSGAFEVIKIGVDNNKSK